jgi:fructokinase
MSNLSPVLVGGEALFDLISRDVGSGLGGSRNFEKRAGGSPFNIAVGVRRLGVPVAFVGKFGVDQFGEALVDFLKNESIDVTHVVRELGTKTTVAFVAVDKESKPEFRFYRDLAADISLREDELTKVQPGVFSIFHCGGIVLAEEPSASAYASLADRFVEKRIPVSLDPTVRQSLISDPDRYLSSLSKLIEKVSILKVSDEELQFLTGTADFDEGVKALPAKEGALVFVTLGRAGASVYRDGAKLAHAPGFAVKAVETTGCGDCFMSAVLAQLAGKSIANLAVIGSAELVSLMRAANAAAAIVATRVGAAEANPTRQEVEQFLAEHCESLATTPSPHSIPR